MPATAAIAEAGAIRACVTARHYVRAASAGLRMRPVTAADGELVYQIYASTRAEEIAATPWSPQQKEAFLRMQSKAQEAHYARHYPHGSFEIIEADGSPCGRLYLHRTPDELEIIDIALLHAFRGRGHGTALLQDLLEEARAPSRHAIIYVEHMNPARRLYERLGFQYAGESGIYFKMRWSSAAATTTATTAVATA